MPVLYQVNEIIIYKLRWSPPGRLVASNDKDDRLRVKRGEILFIIICFSLEIAKLQKNS